MTPRSAAVLVSALAASVALAAAAADRGPRIRFEAMTHDFGTIRSDGKVSFDWTFANDGDAPLEIVGTRPACGCTAAVQDGKPVPPGGRGTLRVTFDPAGLHGSVRKSLAVSSNDPENPRVLLTLRADVIPIERKRKPGEHPPTAGRSLLVGECAACHASPASGREGRDLFASVCGMCHGADGAGGPHGPSLRDPQYLASHDDKTLTTAISYGTANPSMPGFLDVMGGPLSQAQVDSIVRWLRARRGQRTDDAR